MASVIGGVPASNRQGMSLGVNPSLRTSRIISPPPEERRELDEQFAPSPQHPDAGRTEHLVRAEGQEVDAERGHVGREVGNRLGGVGHHHGAGGVGHVGDGARPG